MAEGFGMTDVSRPRRGALRRVLRWFPAAVLLAAVAACWGLVFGGGLAGVAAWLLGLQLLLPLFGAGVLLLSLAYSLWKRRFGPPLLATAAAAVVAMWPACWHFGLFLVKYPASVSRTGPAASVRLPADVPLRVLWGGDDLSVNYHAAYPDQRWAYDLAVDPTFHGSERLEDYGCWGVTVLAPAAGRVVRAHDGEPDEVPGRISDNVEAPSGNHVVIRLATGTHLEIAHLQRGSVAVKEGDDVEEGRPLGRCGNSGNTSEPHIHIHHHRQPPDYAGGILIEGLPLFFRDHDGAPMPKGGFDEVDGRPVPRGDVVRHTGSAPPAR